MYLNPILSARILMSSFVSPSAHFPWSLGTALISVRADEEATDGALATGAARAAAVGVKGTRRGAGLEMGSRW